MAAATSVAAAIFSSAGMTFGGSCGSMISPPMRWNGKRPACRWRVKVISTAVKRSSASACASGDPAARSGSL
jgi:hypothetical protein